MIGASSVALVSILAATSISAESTAVANELVAYGMSLAEFDDIRMSESDADFVGNEALWDEALLFEYSLATSYAEDQTVTSLGYHPYIICNYAPDKTGNKRTQMISEAFQNTSGIDETQFFFEGIGEFNNAERSCGVVRAFNDTIPKVYASNPDAETWMKTNPLNPSMKMIDGTVATVQARMDGDTEIGMISIDKNDNWYIQRSTLQFSNVLCPGVRTQIISGEDISQAAKAFVTEDGGRTVRDASYYYDKVNNGGNDDYTQRMKLWSDAVAFVVNLTDPNGRNPCLDTVIGKTFTFEVSPFIGEDGSGVLEVYSSVSEEEGYVIAEASNMTKGDVDQCVWYTLYAIALQPWVCSVEPKARPQTLCPDLTSDLSQCPPPIPSPTPSQPSSGRVVRVSLTNMMAVFMTIAVLSCRLLN
ncbi:hypothetical protein ACHAWT_000220 [Skeletonema menzelii]